MEYDVNPFRALPTEITHQIIPLFVTPRSYMQLQSLRSKLRDPPSRLHKTVCGYLPAIWRHPALHDTVHVILR